MSKIIGIDLGTTNSVVAVMQSEIAVTSMDYVKRELARGIDDWEQRLGTALVKSSPTDLVRRTTPPQEPDKPKVRNSK